MQRQQLLFVSALIVGLSTTACEMEVPSRQKAAPVVNLGVSTDSATGAVMVRPGDTVWNIAKRYRLAVRDIMDMNGLHPPYHLAEGQRLKLPAPVQYNVHGGDTLYSIASTFGVSVYRLAQVNGLPAPYRLQQGQSLRIPSSYERQEQTGQPMQAVLLKSPVPSVDQPQVVYSFVPERPAVVREALPPPAVVASSPLSPLQTQTTMPSPLPKTTGFVWPVRGKVISAYGPQSGGLYNDGINIAAPRGTPVSAAAEGVVAYVGGDLKSYGNLILIRHSGGTMTAYAHLASVKVKKGMTVRQGQAIGSVGSSGTVSVSQLHFEVRRGSKTYDPKQYLG